MSLVIDFTWNMDDIWRCVYIGMTFIACQHIKTDQNNI